MDHPYTPKERHAKRICDEMMARIHSFKAEEPAPPAPAPQVPPTAAINRQVDGLKALAQLAARLPKGPKPNQRGPFNRL